MNAATCRRVARVVGLFHRQRAVDAELAGVWALAGDVDHLDRRVQPPRAAGDVEAGDPGPRLMSVTTAAKLRASCSSVW